MSEEKQEVRNIIRDTRKDVRYIILASRKLSRDEKLREVKSFWERPDKDKPKSGGEVVIHSEK
ncbi:MAG: hypothetical protein ACLFQX_13095 [Candidatus Kapaibacterium sp.]